MRYTYAQAALPIPTLSSTRLIGPREGGR
jgi:hypothetical protein